MLCRSCEVERFPHVLRKASSTASGPGPKTTVKVQEKRTQQTTGERPASGRSIQTLHDVNETNDLVMECATCLLPANSGDKNGLTCNVCYGYYHLQCINAKIPASDSDTEQIIRIAKLIGWVCYECTVHSTTKLKNLQSAVNTLFEEVNKLKATVAAAETTPSPVSDQSAMLNSKKELVSEVSLVVHQTLNDKARRRCNVVISGLPEPDEGDIDSNNLADRKSFTSLCEQYLDVKPALSNKGCMRLGRYEQSRTTPRKLLVHLNSEISASDLLRASRCLRRNRECANIYINPDLSPAESKIAYEQRKRRRAAAAVLSQAATINNATVNDPHQLFAGHDDSSPVSNGACGLSVNAADFVPTSVRPPTE